MELSIKTVAINNGLHAKEDENAGKASKEMKIAHRSGKGKEGMEKNFRSVRSKDGWPFTYWHHYGNFLRKLI